MSQEYDYHRAYDYPALGIYGLGPRRLGDGAGWMHGPEHPRALYGAAPLIVADGAATVLGLEEHCPWLVPLIDGLLQTGTPAKLPTVSAFLERAAHVHHRCDEEGAQLVPCVQCGEVDAKNDKDPPAWRMGRVGDDLSVSGAGAYPWYWGFSRIGSAVFCAGCKAFRMWYRCSGCNLYSTSVRRGGCMDGGNRDAWKMGSKAGCHEKWCQDDSCGCVDFDPAPVCDMCDLVSSDCSWCAAELAAEAADEAAYAAAAEAANPEPVSRRTRQQRALSLGSGSSSSDDGGAKLQHCGVCHMCGRVSCFEHGTYTRRLAADRDHGPARETGNLNTCIDCVQGLMEDEYDVPSPYGEFMNFWLNHFGPYGGTRSPLVLPAEIEALASPRPAADALMLRDLLEVIQEVENQEELETA